MDSSKPLAKRLIRYPGTDLWYDPRDPMRRKYRRRPDGTFYPAAAGRGGSASRKRTIVRERQRAAVRTRNLNRQIQQEIDADPYVEIEATPDGTLIRRWYYASPRLLLRRERWGSSPACWHRLGRRESPAGDRLVWTPIDPLVGRQLASSAVMRRLVPVEVQPWLADLYASEPGLANEPPIEPYEGIENSNE